MKIITEREINYYTDKAYIDDGDKIIGIHNPIDGEVSFSLCVIEQLLGLLNRSSKDDKSIIAHTRTLIDLSNEEANEYSVFLTHMYDNNIKEISLKKERLTQSQRKIIKEFATTLLGEYLLKSDEQSCCYTAMKAFLIGLYCILIAKIDFETDQINLIADLDDRLTEIKVFKARKPVEHLIVRWYSANRIESMYLLYKTQYSGLEDESILDLVSADVIEEEYYINDERFKIAPSLLMKQYLSIIERETNIIIDLSGYGNPDKPHLMWYDMKNLIRKKGINLDFLDCKFHEVLDDLYKFRNDTMHGKINITTEDYEILTKYKNDGLFKAISAKKLKLQGIELHPTVDEIGDILGD